jgi:alkanesulfonate monooxygenase SsuD/methylene tetrahydromethanopterin reductase-like flavin-dependent oxidoreductase (luciferase family)
MKIGVSMFLTEKTGNPGAIAREAENLGFDSFWVAEHLVMPVTYSTWYPRGKDGKVPEFYAARFNDRHQSIRRSGFRS